jgi:hypothetical protein
VRNFLSRMFGERTGETLVQSGDGEMRAGEVRADLLLGDLDAGVQPPPPGEPAPVEADEAAWTHEREQRERDGRQGRPRN